MSILKVKLIGVLVLPVNWETWPDHSTDTGPVLLLLEKYINVNTDLTSTFYFFVLFQENHLSFGREY